MKRRICCPDWIANLQVGDVVCDCRYQHLKIAEMLVELFPWHQHFVRQIVFARWMPMFIGEFLYDAYEKFCDKIEWHDLWDVEIVLEDGARCSARNCCSPGDHGPIQGFYHGLPAGDE